jgi:hypothetical protein
MALEKFTHTTKYQVINVWYPEESKNYIREIILEAQIDLNRNPFSKILRKDEIKFIIKNLGKPSHVLDSTYLDYVNNLKLLEEWD